jgi:hypothetical protein
VPGAPSFAHFAKGGKPMLLTNRAEGSWFHRRWSHHPCHRLRNFDEVTANVTDCRFFRFIVEVSRERPSM